LPHPHPPPPPLSLCTLDTIGSIKIARVDLGLAGAGGAIARTGGPCISCGRDNIILILKAGIINRIKYYSILLFFFIILFIFSFFFFVRKTRSKKKK
jgi:hypothetical protein